MRPIAQLVTNNPAAAAKYEDMYEVVFVEGTAAAVITAVRDFIHTGRRLLTHPLASSVPPKDSPYKSVLISGEASAGPPDFDSLRIIEGAAAVYSKIDVTKINIPQAIAEDFMAIDCEMLAGRINPR